MCNVLNIIWEQTRTEPSLGLVPRLRILSNGVTSQKDRNIELRSLELRKSLLQKVSERVISVMEQPGH